MIGLVFLEAQEGQVDRLQDHPEKHKLSVDLDVLNYDDIKLTVIARIMSEYILAND